MGVTEYNEHSRKCGTGQLSSEYCVCDRKYGWPYGAVLLAGFCMQYVTIIMVE